MPYRCPRCGGADYYFQKVQVGNRIYDFNPSDSNNVSGDLIPDYLQVPGQMHTSAVMKDAAYCKACPSPVQMDYLKPPKDPMCAKAAWALALTLCFVPLVPIVLARRALDEIKNSDTQLGGKKIAILAMIHNSVVILVLALSPIAGLFGN